MQVKDIDHLGIVAGIIDQIGLVEIVNQELGNHPQEKASAGIVLKAMIMNGLGFVSAPLYLFSQFFEGKATEHLLGEGIKAKHLNDDRLGRVLDQLFAKGITSLFIKIAMNAAQVMKVSPHWLHLDSSSFHVHGEYLTNNSPTTQEPIPIKLTRGYSRDHRPDLKQFIIDLMCSGDGDIPIYLRVADGNETDQGVFAKLIQDFKSQCQIDATFVADAALYSEENLQLLGDLKWISRVPATLKATVELMENFPEEALKESQQEGYRIAAVCNTYAGVKQRWLLVESAARKASDLKQLEEKLQQHPEKAQKKLKKLGTQNFACEPDALSAAHQLNQQLPYHQLEQIKVVSIPCYGKAGRPRKDHTPSSYHFQVQATITIKEQAIALARRRAGRFILATNILDAESLTDDTMLSEYKEQQSTERGFRFLKDPLFFTSSVFLKNPQRVAALAMIMGLCLLVYTLAQRALRQALAEEEETVNNQVGKPTPTPTIRWIFQCFQSIHWVFLNGATQITNLSNEHRKVLSFLGSPCQKYYLLV